MIQHFLMYIKSRERALFFALTAGILVVFVSGMWQYRSSTYGAGQSVPISYIKGAFSIKDAPLQDTKQFVASKNGSKFYPVDCASAGRIKEENRLYFASIDAAMLAGFEPTKTCP